jgi:hypothetical protein
MRKNRITYSHDGVLVPFVEDEEKDRYPSKTKEYRRDYMRRHRGQEIGEPLTEERYGRWVPGGDGALALEDVVDRYIAGNYDYDTALRLALSITDAAGLARITKRDFLVVLSRKREVHHQAKKG